MVGSACRIRSPGTQDTNFEEDAFGVHFFAYATEVGATEDGGTVGNLGEDTLQSIESAGQSGIARLACSCAVKAIGSEQIAGFGLQLNVFDGIAGIGK